MSDSFQLLLETAKAVLTNVEDYGPEQKFISGGYNGPYFDVETPIRNTSHWLVTSSVLYEETGTQVFYDLAMELCNFLMKPGFYERNGVLIHRQKPGKDWCNGVIGQAWVIEALVVSSQLLKRNDAFDKAGKLARAFSFSCNAKAWTKTDPANGKKRIDYTLNHQLWYAAAIAMLDDAALNAQIHTFLDALHAGAMRVRKSGVISHLFYSSSAKGRLLRLRYRLAEFRNHNAVTTKEVGYHLYNLHPLARLKCHFPTHPIFQSRVIQSALDTAFSDEFLAQLDCNKYAYPYNAPAFEYPLIERIFQHQNAVSSKAWDRQLVETFDDGVTGFTRNCPDPMTLNARVYEWFLNVFYDRYHQEGK